MVEKIDDLFEKHYLREKVLNDNAFKVNQQ